MNNRGIFSKYFFLFMVMSVYFFLYLPIGVLIIYSFNDESLGYRWAGFTTKWYYALFNSPEVWDVLYNSLIVASTAVLLSLSMGTLFVFYSSSGYLKRLLPVFYTNLAVPEIVLAVGLLSFFYFFSVPLGLTTLIASHTLIALGYVVPIMHAQYTALDKSLIEASLDLGATQMQTFFAIVLPLLSPALIAASLLVFIISFDDFILSFFCAGASTQTLPMYIFSMIRSGASPIIGALSTLLLIGSSLLVLFFSVLQVKKTNVVR